MKKISDNDALDTRLSRLPTENLPLQKDGSVYWDDHLIPFIEAQTDDDCAFLLGLVHAHLRIGQMSLMLRVAQGRLAECVGPLAIGIDQTLRIMDLGAAVDQIVAEMAPQTKKWIERYTEGINHYQSSMKKLPSDLVLCGIRAEPWTVHHVVLLGRLMSADVNWINWFQWMQLRDKPYWARLWERMVSMGFNSISSFATDTSTLGRLFLSTAKSGSNAVAVGGARTADSGAIIITDPHLGLQIPNTWLIAGYSSPSYHVAGLMFPGIPAILVGRNRSIGWAGTNMRSASSDLFQLSQQQVAGCTTTTQTIKVRFWADKEIAIRHSEFGPVISDSPLFKNISGKAMAVRWVGHSPSDEITAFLRLNRATNWQEFNASFETYAVSGQNFLYGDTDGHIGMVPAVRIPRRNYHTPDDFILHGEELSHLWDGFLNTNELPTAFDPAEGFIVSANNRPVVHTPPLGFFFSANDRAQRLRQLCSTGEPITMAYARQIQHDVFVPSAQVVRDSMAGALARILGPAAQSQSQNRLLSTLYAWDCNFRADSRGPVAFQLIMYHFITLYFSKIFDPQVASMLRSSEHVNHYVYAAFQNDRGPSLDSVLLAAVDKAAEEFDSFKSWGDMHRLHLNHPLSRIPLLGRKYRFGEYPVDGSFNTLLKSAHTVSNRRHKVSYGANARFITNLHDLDENFVVLLGGQDGTVESRYCVDQVTLWQTNNYIRLPLRMETVKQSFRHHCVMKTREKPHS